jgi:hypothetical protein
MDMPGTIYVDTGRTFATMIAMGCGPKMAFGTEQQDVSKNGEKKWALQVAVTYVADPGMRAVSEVIDVTVTGGDQAPLVKPGDQIEVTDLRVGISTPQARENGKGISGGRPWYQASGARVAGGAKFGGKDQAAA